jgi:hypothetical protein
LGGQALAEDALGEDSQKKPDAELFTHIGYSLPPPAIHHSNSCYTDWIVVVNERFRSLVGSWLPVGEQFLLPRSVFRA